MQKDFRQLNCCNFHLFINYNCDYFHVTKRTVGDAGPYISTRFSINREQLSHKNKNDTQEIFKTKGLHEFKKAEFAKLVRDKITEDADLSSEIKDIIKEIYNINKNA